MIDQGWHKNGQPRYEHNLHNGQPHGVDKGWHENGQLWYKISYHQDQRHGISKYWHSDGKLIYEKYFLYGNKVTEEEYRRHEIIEKLSGL